MKTKNFIKENKLLIIISFIISLFIFIPLFRPGMMNSHDLSFHLSRFSGIISALKDKQFPIAIYPYKNFGYGYASPMFYSDFFLFIPALINEYLGLPLITTYKLLLFVIIYLTSFFTMFTINKIFKNKVVAITCAIVLVSTEYYLTDFYLRSALGELLGTCLLPLLFYFTYLFIVEEKDNYLSIGIIFALILNSHNITFLFCVASFAIFVLFNIKKFINNKKMIITLIKATAIGILFSFAFLVPMLEQYTAQSLRVQKVIINDFGGDAIKLNELFSDFFMQFQFKLNNYDLLEEVGTIKNLGLLCTLLPLTYIFSKKNKYINQLVIMFILYMYMSTEFFPIENFSILRFIQFSPRFYIMTPMFVIYILAYSLTHFSNKINNAVLVIVSLYMIINSSFLFSALLSIYDVVWFPENATSKEIFEEGKYWWWFPENDDWNWYEIGRGEYLCNNYYSYSAEGTCIDDGNGETIERFYAREGTNIKFTIDLDRSKTVQLPLTWYKGYAVYEVDENHNILQSLKTYASPAKSRVAFDGLPGKHNYMSQYVGTPIQKISVAVNIISIIAVAYLETKRRKKYEL